jgi:DNA mismatch repair ATPase MutL
LRSCQNPPLGYEWKYENGELKSKSQIACSKGTVITITNFFGNVPVRLLNLQKHYKKYVKECLDLVYYYTFLPIRFKIVSDKTMETNGQLIDSIRTLFGSKQVQQMTFIDNDIVTGYISKPNMQALRKEKRQYCFLNNRPCLLPKLGKLLSNVYEFVGLFPCFVLFLKIDSNRFDRNVTPDKLSLIMEDDDLFLGEVVDVISAAIEPLRGSMDMLVSSSSEVSVFSQLGMSQSKLGQAASQVGLKEPQKRALSQLEIDFPVKQIVIEDSVDSADPLVKDSLGKDTESPTTPISSQKVYDSPVRFVDKLWKEREDAEHRFSKLIGQDHPQRI